MSYCLYLAFLFRRRSLQHALIACLLARSLVPDDELFLLLSSQVHHAGSYTFDCCNSIITIAIDEQRYCLISLFNSVEHAPCL
jgi:hypothetical protein